MRHRFNQPMIETSSIKLNGRITALAIWAILLLLSAFLGIRRAIGGFPMPESSLAACTMATFIAGIHLLASYFYIQTITPTSKKYWRQVTTLGAFCFPFLLACPLLSTDSTFTIMYVLTLGSVVAGVLFVLNDELIFPVNSRRMSDPEPPNADSISPTHTIQHASPVQVRPNQTFEMAEISTVGPVSSSFQPSQQFERVMFDDGTEQVHGVFRFCFAANQKLATAHIPFSPPLEILDDFELGPISQAGIRIKPALVKTYGIRLEAHRSQASEQNFEMAVSFTVTGRSMQLRAA